MFLLNPKCRLSSSFCLPTNISFFLLCKGVTNHIVLLLNPKNVLRMLFSLLEFGQCELKPLYISEGQQCSGVSLLLYCMSHACSMPLSVTFPG